MCVLELSCSSMLVNGAFCHFVLINGYLLSENLLDDPAANHALVVALIWIFFLRVGAHFYQQGSKS